MKGLDTIKRENKAKPRRPRFVTITRTVDGVEFTMNVTKNAGTGYTVDGFEVGANDFERLLALAQAAAIDLLASSAEKALDAWRFTP